MNVDLKETPIETQPTPRTSRRHLARVVAGLLAVIAIALGAGSLAGSDTPATPERPLVPFVTYTPAGETVSGGSVDG